jgi:hypothetical protein
VVLASWEKELDWDRFNRELAAGYTEQAVPVGVAAGPVTLAEVQGE